MLARRTLAAAALLAPLAAFTAGAAHAEMMTFTAKLTAASEVPPKDSKGTGTATVMLDTATKKITYDVTYSGLTGPATMAHIHGPAPVGENAGVITPLMPPASPIKGTATLTDAQIADMEAGKYYVNVHTEKNKGGEIRGQLMKQ
jgi:hypothetical protein